MRGMFYTCPNELSSKSLKNIELVQANFVPGQSGIDVLLGSWTMSNIQGEKEKEKWGNNDTALK